ncbi:MAG: hypothetical protein WC699_03285 [Bacteroidales bacterium]|jgi:hypothetical protein
MNKLTFSFLKNKFFIAGFIAGLLVAFMVTIVFISPYLPSAEKNKLKGTLSGTGFEPAVGDKGKVIYLSHANYCEGQPPRAHVHFDNGDGSLTICRSYDDAVNQVNARVIVVRLESGDFCDGGGVWVSVDQ